MADQPPSDPAIAFWTPRRRHYVLFVLCLVGIANFIDRQILAVLLEPIKRDLKLDDTAMGLLSGAAFAVFYVTAAMPLARLADRGSRRNLIVACLTVWSICTALCGFVTSCFQSTIARMGVAGGEAGAYPASQSILADLYPPSSSSAAGSPRRSWCRGRREHAAQGGDNQIPPPTLPFRGREAERLRRSI